MTKIQTSTSWTKSKQAPNDQNPNKHQSDKLQTLQHRRFGVWLLKWCLEFGICNLKWSLEFRIWNLTRILSRQYSSAHHILAATFPLPDLMKN